MSSRKLVILFMRNKVKKSRRKLVILFMHIKLGLCDVIQPKWLPSIGFNSLSYKKLKLSCFSFDFDWVYGILHDLIKANIADSFVLSMLLSFLMNRIIYAFLFALDKNRYSTDVTLRHWILS